MVDQRDFEKLENALIETGRSIQYPPTPRLAGNVRQRLQTDRAAPPARSIFRSRRFVIGLAAILLAIALLLIPQTREVIAQLLGLRTIRIIETTPTPSTSPAPTMSPAPTPGVAPFRQCCPATLAEAQQRADFKLLLPPTEAPTQVFFQDQVFGRGSEPQQVVMIFGEPDRPRFVLYQAHFWLYEKLLTADSRVGRGTLITETQVSGQRALWLTGEPHLLVTLDRNGEPVIGWERPVNANTLIWETRDSSGEVTYRLETTLGLADAIEFAEALR